MRALSIVAAFILAVVPLLDGGEVVSITYTSWPISVGMPPRITLRAHANQVSVFTTETNPDGTTVSRAYTMTRSDFTQLGRALQGIDLSSYEVNPDEKKYSRRNIEEIKIGTKAGMLSAVEEKTYVVPKGENTPEADAFRQWIKRLNTRLDGMPPTHSRKIEPRTPDRP